MGSQGKHVARGGTSASLSAVGKHAAPERGRSRLARMVAIAVAVSVVVVGALLALRQTTPSTSAGETAVTVSTGRVASGPETLTAPGIDRLVAYGHSMPEGGGASDPSLGYVVLAAELLGLEVVNHARGGSGAANATLTMKSQPAAGPTDAVVLHTGMNDIFRRGDGAVGRGRQAIKSFLRGTSGAGSRVIILECQPGSWVDTPPGRDLQSAYESWNEMLREEAALARDVELLDICEIWNPARFTNVAKYHPNDDGHARMATELAEMLADS